MKSFLSSHILVGTHLLLVALTFSSAAAYVHYQNRAVLDALNTEVAIQEESLMHTERTLSANGSDEFVASIIQDCEQRSEFDALIANLANLSRQDLIKTQQLMAACGDYYPTQASLMTERLKENHDALVFVLDLRTRITDSTPLAIDTQSWSTLVNLEDQRASYLREQYSIQETIIRQLIQGSSRQELMTSVAQAQEIAELLSVTNVQLRTIRSNLGI